MTRAAPRHLHLASAARRTVSLVALALAVLLAAATPAVAQTEAGTTQDLVPVVADAYVLVDVATGRVLAARDLHGPRLVASTVKIVTALTAVRLIAPDQPVAVTPRAAAKPAMRIGMQAGQEWRRDDALASMMMVSANDAAYALAETASGSVEAFAVAMAETGAQLGLRDSTFADPAGFDDSFNAEIGPSKMSVHDLAVASRALLADPTLRTIVGTRVYEFTGPDGGHTLTNHSRMLRPTTPKYYEGTDGIKTGYTKRARGTFVASATRDGRTLIAVVLGNVDIYTPARQLLDYGFSLPAGAAGVGVTLPAVPALAPADANAAAADDAGTGAALQAAAPGGTTPAGGDPGSAPSATPAADEGAAGGWGHWPLDALLLGALAMLAVLGVRVASRASAAGAAAAPADRDGHEDQRGDERSDPPALRRLHALERQLTLQGER